MEPTVHLCFDSALHESDNVRIFHFEQQFSKHQRAPAAVEALWYNIAQQTKNVVLLAKAAQPNQMRGTHLELDYTRVRNIVLLASPSPNAAIRTVHKVGTA